MKSTFEIGDTVEVEADRDDIFTDFCGTVIGFRNGVVQVKDQDDNVFECFKSQLKVLECN